MNRITFVLALLALPCAATLAQTPGGGGPMIGGSLGLPGNINGNGGAGSTTKPPAEAAKSYIQSFGDSITFTDDQIQQIDDIFADRAQQLADFNAQNAAKVTAAGEAMSTAFNSQDKDAMTKTAQDYQAAIGPRQDILKKAQDRLDKILTPAQKAQLADARLTAMIKWMVKPVELTDKQMKAVKAAAHTGDNPMENFAAIRDTLDTVLTFAQKSAINKSHALEAVKKQFMPAGLTADQLKKIDAACDQIAKDLSLDQKAITDALAEKTNALLTPEQKKAMESPAKTGQMRMTHTGDGK